MNTTEYRNLKPWTIPSDYMGAYWFGWYPVYDQSRDSSALERSNYKRILEDLKAFNTELKAGDVDARNHGDDTEGDDTVTDTRCSNWAVGWVETIYVHSSNVPACEKADEILSALEGYPVYDESDMSATESEDEQCAWDNWVRSDFDRAVNKRLESWLMNRMDAGGVDEKLADERIARVIADYDNLDSAQLANLFYETANDINEYWTHDSGGASIDVDAVAGAVDMGELFASLGETEAIFGPALFCRFDPWQLWMDFVK